MTADQSIPLTLHSIDNGNCQVHFTSPTGTLYCFQRSIRGGFLMFQCTDEGEPLAQVDMTRFEPDFVEGQDSTIPIAREYNEWLGELVLDSGVSPTVSY